MLIKHNKKHTWYGEEITETQYNEILSLLQSRPTAPDGYGYRLTESLEWELYELLPAEEEETEATEADCEAPAEEDEIPAEDALAELVEVLR